jgi:chitinase
MIKYAITKVIFLYWAISTMNLVSSQQDGMIIAGYLPDYRSYINVDEAANFLSDLILFSLSPESSGEINDSSCCLDKSHYEKGRQARVINPNLSILVSVGGGGRSNAFAKLSSSEHGRHRLITDLIKLCKKEELNGVDLDWEQPKSKEEMISYLHLIVEASTALHQEGLVLSVALHVNQFLPKEVYEYIDRIHLMTYDMIASRGSHHASHDNVLKAVDDIISSGCDPSRIVVGLPAYGRHGKSPGMVKTYSEVIDEVIDANSEAMEDLNSLFSTEEYGGFLFDSPNMIQAKVKMVVQKGLKGVFFWELGQDYRNDKSFPGGLLLQSASTPINKDEL